LSFADSDSGAREHSRDGSYDAYPRDTTFQNPNNCPSWAAESGTVRAYTLPCYLGFLLFQNEISEAARHPGESGTIDPE